MTQDKHWLVRHRTIRALWLAFAVILATTVVADFFVHRHQYFNLDGSFGFFAWYGLLTCVGMIVFAKLLGLFLKRPDDYYDRAYQAPEDVDD